MGEAKDWCMPMTSWDEWRVQGWLRWSNHTRAADLLADQGVDGMVLTSISTDDLRDVGLTLGEAHTLISAIQTAEIMAPSVHPSFDVCSQHFMQTMPLGGFRFGFLT